MTYLVILLVCALSGKCFADSSSSESSSSEDAEPNMLYEQSHIIGGVAADRPIPYQVSLRVKADPNSSDLGPRNLRHFCGASLISNNHILTASHCFNADNLRRMKLGQIYAVIGTSLYDFDPSNTFVSRIAAVAKHPQYRDDDFHDDIAVLRLSEPVTTSSRIGTVSLRSHTPAAGANCIVSGWGTMRSGAHKPPRVLQFVNLPIIDQGTCSRAYAKLDYPIVTGMLCAGETAGGVDACQGDSGGPLVCDGELTGVVSWGYECGLPGVPGVYADVATYRSWVMQTMGTLDRTVRSSQTPQPPIYRAMS